MKWVNKNLPVEACLKQHQTKEETKEIASSTIWLNVRNSECCHSEWGKGKWTTGSGRSLMWPDQIHPEVVETSEREENTNRESSKRHAVRLSPKHENIWRGYGKRSENTRIWKIGKFKNLNTSKIIDAALNCDHPKPSKINLARATRSYARFGSKLIILHHLNGGPPHLKIATPKVHTTSRMYFFIFVIVRLLRFHSAQKRFGLPFKGKETKSYQCVFQMIENTSVFLRKKVSL